MFEGGEEVVINRAATYDWLLFMAELVLIDCVVAFAMFHSEYMKIGIDGRGMLKEGRAHDQAGKHEPKRNMVMVGSTCLVSNVSSRRPQLSCPTANYQALKDLR